MNTEQLKTAKELIQKQLGKSVVFSIDGQMIGDINAKEIVVLMETFASQESKKAVDEFKKKLRNEYKDKIAHTKKTLEQVPPAWTATRTALEAICTEYEYLIDKL